MANIFDKKNPKNKEMSKFLESISRAAKKKKVKKEEDDGSVFDRFSKIMKSIGRSDPKPADKKLKQKKIEREAERKGSLGDVIKSFSKDMSK